jgi:glycerol kinase
MLMQFQAELLRCAVVRPAVTETTALGAAYLAGLAVGVWKTPQELESQWRVEKRFEPSMAESRVRELRGQWSRAVGRAKEWAKP